MKKVFRFFGMGGHDCRDVVEKLEVLIDGELDNTSQEKLIRDIERCPACLEHYHLDKAFKDFVQKRTERKCCAERVKTEILQRIKEINTDENSVSESPA